MLSDEEKRALSKVRLEHAAECLEEAESLLSAEQYRERQTAHIMRFSMRYGLCLRWTALTGSATQV